MSKAVYFDCFSGASGDMILGALLDAGLPLKTLQDGLARLHLPGLEIQAQKTVKNGITATAFRVIEENHSQAHPDHVHPESGSSAHAPAPAGHGAEHAHHHHHRGLREITEIIQAADLADGVKQRSLEIFRRLGEAEAAVHGVPLEEIHFHELGALDTIVDIVGCVLALDALGIQECYASPLPTGSGTVHTAHGLLPVPAPATLKILTAAGAPLIPAPASAEEPGEMLTPTGAVLITSLAKFQRPALKLEKSGCGAGFKDFAEWPNVLRVLIGETADSGPESEMVLLETNIDDMTPQVYGYLMEKLLAEKAADVWFTPIQMKKNRPAVMLSVLAAPDLESRLAEIILRETTTLGLRVKTVSRRLAQREIRPFESSLGRVQIKIKTSAGSILEIAPEYEDIRRLAQANNLPFLQVQHTVMEEARRAIQG